MDTANEIGRTMTGNMADSVNSGVIRSSQVQLNALPSSNGACTRMASLALSDFGFNTTLKISTCESFHRGPVAIKLPRDTPVLKWGALSPLSTSRDRFTFIDRDGIKTEFPSHLMPSWLIPGMRPYWVGQSHVQWSNAISQILFSVRLSSGKVAPKITTVIPAILIQHGALMQPFQKATFIGRATQLNRNGTKIATYPVRWDLESATRSKLNVTLHGMIPVLRGSFSNLLRASLDSKKRCHPALCSDNATCSLFTDVKNPSDDVMFGWLPSLNEPLDSEMVVIFPDGVFHSSLVPPIHKLSTTNISLKNTFSFYLHNDELPRETVLYYQGMFKLNAKRPRRCNPVH